MDVEQRLSLAADFLHRESVGWDADGFTERLMAAAGIPTPPAEPDAPAATPPGPRGGYRQEGNGSDALASFRAELNQLLLREERAEGGEEAEMERESVRRIAELTELLDGRPASLPWWHRAAQAGDELAAVALEE